MTREIVIAIARSSLEPQTKVRLLGLVGIGIEQRSWLHRWEQHAADVNASCRVIIDRFSGSASLVDVLGAISFLPTLSFAKMIPVSALEGCRQHGELYRQAAAVLRINGLEWEKPGAQIAADVLKLRSRYPEHLGELLAFIDSHGLSGAELEAFVIALMKVPESNLLALMRGALLGLLIKLVGRRPAVDSLPDPSSMKPQNRGSS